MLPEGTRPADVTDALAKAVIDRVNVYRQASGVSVSAIGKRSGYSGSVISQVLNRKYAGDWRTVLIDLDRWLEDQLKQDAAPKTTTFVWTQVATEIKTVADVAIQLRTIGLVYGPETSGVGKTLALQAIQQEKAGALLITVEKVAANATGVLDAIARALQVGTGGNNRLTFDRVKNVLRDTPRLLMVDQIHNLCGASKDDKAFYVLADLHDATNGAPQLWCGTSDVVAYLDRGQARGKEPLAQIRRRIGIRRDLMERTREGDRGRGQPLYSIDEVRKIFGSNKMRLSADGARYLWMLACLPDSGALGAAKNVVTIATAVAEVKGETLLTADHLRAANRQLVNGRAFSLLEARMSEQQQPLAIARAG